MGSINSIIKKAPNFIQKAYFNIIPFEKRYGKVFADTLKFLNESKKWSKEQALEYQNLEFKKLIKHCYNNVPYYNKLFKKNNLIPEDFRETSDIKLLPILTKAIIRENIEELKAVNILNQKIYQFKTSGSTGEKLVFYGTDEVYKKEAAFILRSYQQHGADLYNKSSIWLRRYVPLERNQDLWYFDYELKRLYMSSYHINENTIYSYIEKINSIEAPTLVGYPSSIYILSCLCAKFNLKLKYVKKIHVSSEMMLDEWRAKIIETFNIIPIAHYGAIEKVSFMHQTENSSMYHENLEYGINEFINENGYYTIVGTGFLNYYMPFLRYKTEDTVILNKNPNSSNFPNTVEKIIGRSSDILIAKDGSRLPGVNFYSWIDKSIYGVQMFQIVQEEIERVKFNFVRSDKYSDQTLDDIRKGLISRLGDIKIEIEEVAEIKRNIKNGKIRCIINNIK